MKTKDVLVLAIAAAIFVVTGVVGYNAMTPKKAASGKGVTIQTFPLYKDSFNQDALKAVTDQSANTDYYQAPDFSQGLGNPNNFGQF